MSGRRDQIVDALVGDKHKRRYYVDPEYHHFINLVAHQALVLADAANKLSGEPPRYLDVIDRDRVGLFTADNVRELMGSGDGLDTVLLTEMIRGEDED